jgi:hypothetical protein
VECGIRIAEYDEVKAKVTLEVEKKLNVKSKGQRVLDFSVEISKNLQIVWTSGGEIEIENH